MNTPMDTPAQDHIWTRAYTPAGFQVSITVHFANGQPMSATELDSLLTSNGYLPSLPGTEPGEEVETMTHVVRRVHTNTDGSTTPIIAFYHENTRLEFKFDHKYLNTADEIAEFEALAGIRLADIPLCEWPSYPKRSDANAQRYVVKLPNPVKVVAVDSTYTKDDGSTGTTKKIKSFVGATPTVTPQDQPANAAPGIEFFDKPAPKRTPPASNDDGNAFVDMAARRRKVLDGTKDLFDNDMNAMMQWANANGVNWHNRSAEIIEYINEAMAQGVGA